MANATRTVRVKRPLPGVPGNAFEPTGHAAAAIVQPMSGSAAAQMYGLHPSEMRLLLCEPEADVRQGDGVCVDVADAAEPDFRVVYAARWAWHAVVHLQLIPEGKRGADA